MDLPAGAGGQTISAGGACPEQGSGEVVIEITGLPEGVEADVLIAGPTHHEVKASGTLTDVAAGSYAVTAARVYDADPLVRTVFDANVTTPDFCVAPGASQSMAITYAAIPSSNRLWSVNDSSLLGFPANALDETGSSSATVKVPATVRSAAFDRDGHLWTVGGRHILRFASLGVSGAEDVSIALPNLTCDLPQAHLAFDLQGNLWVAKFCPEEVLRIAASDLGTSGEKEPDASFTNVPGADALAFDQHGNLWVTSPRKLMRFDAARLGGIDSDPADLELSIVTTGGSSELWPTGFAFDAAGNLWGLSFFENLLFRLAPPDLAGSGVRTVEVKAADVFAVGVATLSTLPAFDDSGGLWFGVSHHPPTDTVIGRFSPEQLAMNSGGFIEPEVQITSPGSYLGRVATVAFFPAPVGLPLFHSLPAP